MGNEDTAVEDILYFDYIDVNRDQIIDLKDFLQEESPEEYRIKNPRRFRWLHVTKLGERSSEVWIPSKVKGYPRKYFKETNCNLEEINHSFSKIQSLDVLVPNEHELWEQLAQMPQMATPLLNACEFSREEFPDSELSLEIFFDSESDDQYPILYIRQQTYEKDIMIKIEKIMEKFDWFFQRNMGWFLITTDFQSGE